MAMTQQLGNDGSEAAASLRAVLFDMDGTLVETEQYWGEAMFELAAALGGLMSPAARAATIGSSMRTSMGILHADLGLVRTEEQLQADGRWVTERTAQLLALGVSWCPGAAELVRAVRAAGLRTALVTTTPRRLAEIVLGTIRADLGEDPFEVTVCGDEVPARKPDPAPYHQAMAALGVAPEECVVVEDSLAGITAGLAAGASVLGVPAAQDVAPAARLTVRKSLVDVDVRTLVELLAGCDAEADLLA